MVTFILLLSVWGYESCIFQSSAGAEGNAIQHLKKEKPYENRTVKQILLNDLCETVLRKMVLFSGKYSTFFWYLFKFTFGTN